MSNTYLAFDRPDVAATFVRRGKHQTSEVLLLVEDIRCTACCLAIEKALAPLAGITEVQVNPATRHARIQWNSAQLSLSCIMQTIADCGFTPLPLSDDTVAAVQREQSRAALRRLFVAGLGMMQLMTYAVATYAGAFDGISDTYLEFFRLLSLLVATPVVFYSAGPFFRGAIRDLVRGRAGMDVPVAVAIGLAYLASVLIVLFGKLHTEIYFDSVVMFTFFLSCGRFIEMVARHRSIGSGEALAQSVPATAQRFDAGGGTTTVPTRILQVNDRLLIRSGETIPADAVVTRGESSTDEALLTGESVPRRKRPGDTVIAGSLNLGAPLEVKVTRTGADTILSGISHMLERAQDERPRIALLADRVAGWFVAAVLLFATSVGIAWLSIDAARALPVALSVLVVTCPCALSLATPAALSAATGWLSRRGVLVTRGTALEKLARVDTLFLDKTGTLTTGRLEVVAVDCLDPELSETRCRAIAASLEAGSTHPVATALGRHASAGKALDIEDHAGRGIEASVDNVRYRIGSADFVSELTGHTADPGFDDHGNVYGAVYLGRADRLLARFTLEDAIRPETLAAVDALRQRGVELAILSGDSAAPVASVASQLGIDDFTPALMPDQKLDILRARRRHGGTIAMIGDGINDAPVLAGADVSLAMGSGAAMAHASADLVLVSSNLHRLVESIDTARKTVRIIRQNISWAIGYNAVALPLAAAGFVAPWMAAIGMSASSILVVLNSLRLGRSGRSPQSVRESRDGIVAEPTLS